MRITTVVFALLVLSAVAAFVPGGPPGDEPPPPGRSGDTDQALREAYPHLHNLMALPGEIYSGAEPDGEAAFGELRRLGVKTIVSVDGAKPDVKAARAAGIRYVHIPMGYDGVSAHAAASLTAAVRNRQGPIYIHCHHGRHRGPAAAAVACMAAGKIDARGADEYLHAAGTSPDYAGLWRDVKAFRAAPEGAPLPELVETAAVPSLAAAMAAMDRAYDRLKLCSAAAWDKPPGHPDVAPRQQALLVKEGLREAARHLPPEGTRQLTAWLQDAERTAQHLESALREGDGDTATRHFEALSASCKRCHAKFRN